MLLEVRKKIKNKKIDRFRDFFTIKIFWIVLDPKNPQINLKCIFYVLNDNHLLNFVFFFLFRKILISVSSLFLPFFFYFFRKSLTSFTCFFSNLFFCVFDNIYLPFYFIIMKICDDFSIIGIYVSF